MWWAVWRCSWLKITWSSTWTEPPLGVRCRGSAGSRNVTKWLTGGGQRRKLWRNYSNILIDVLCDWMGLLFCVVMAGWGRTSSLWSSLIPPGSYALSWLYPGPSSGNTHTNQQNESPRHQWYIDCNCGCTVVVLLSSAVWSLWIRSSMSTAWMNWQRSSPWSTSISLRGWCSKYLWPLGGDNEL